MKTALALAACAALTSPSAGASPLFSASGEWTGTGRIAPNVEFRMERALCRIEVKQTPGEDDVSISGRCAVAGGARKISMRYVKQPNGAVRAGFWSPSENLSVQYGGSETTDTVTLQALEPVAFDGEFYNSRVTMAFLSETEFTFEQIVQKQGVDHWVRVVDMRFEK